MLDPLRQRNFAFLWLAGLISIAGDLALIVALPLHVYRLTGSTLATAGTFAASTIPRVLAGSLAGVFVDRWDRRRTMIVADLLRALVLLPLLLAPDQIGLIYAIAAVQGTIGLFFRPAESALLPLLVGQEHLISANALNALNDNLGMLVGPALGSLLYAGVGIGGVLLADAATYVASALLIGLVRVRSRRSDVGGTDDSLPTSDLRLLTRLTSEWRQGMTIIRQDRALRVLFASAALAGVAEGIFVTLSLSPLVLDVLGGTPAQVGWLGSAQAVGGLIGGVAVAHLGSRLSTRWLFGGGLAGLGVADLATANARLIAGPGLPAVGVAMSWSALAGFPAVATGTGRQTIVQTQIDDAYRGRVFGALSAAVGGAMLAGFALGGVLGGTLGIVPTLTADGLVRVLGGLLALWRLPRPTSQEQRASPPGKALTGDALR